ncbi:N-formylglutamate amidohydrolase [Martelella sp. AD-3]|uniref:N-formylglutamate amidohydrolase n=1 Tax=Martelella sp. AD-3 TaxID=686597 RepID=UPI0004668F41|nr:N-formylglutamate amidohydrolase [Martelella sp. AD-3]AMM84013.1 N-formylglutamate amidohydrolase [Martelella sp. AD-3]MAM10997.1 N-formylglutamate amidohydrolase [Rhizobiaceae bacterium]
MLGKPGLLSARDGAPVIVERALGQSEVVLVCEHAGRAIPDRLGDMGLSAELLQSHIAWDPGALAVSRLLSAALDATLVHQRFSRLVYDCNRPPEAADAIPEISEIYAVPANRGLGPVAKAERAEALYLPFHERIDELLDARASAGRDAVLVTIHSFTPVFKGKRRDVEIGILHDADKRLADCMLDRAKAIGGYDVRRNEPYAPVDGVTHTLRRHALPRKLPNVMIEIRNDLIADAAGQGAVAGFVAGLLSQCLDGRREVA